MQSSRGMTVHTVEFITNRCRELWAFRGSFVEEVVRELRLEGQAGFGQGMGEGRRHGQRETPKLCSWPRFGMEPKGETQGWQIGLCRGKQEKRLERV